MTIESGGTVRTVSALAVIDLANELMARRLLAEDELQNISAELCGMRAGWMNGTSLQEHRLPETLFIQLWQIADARASDDALGLQIGATLNTDTRGVLANWLYQCSTLAEAFSTFSSNIPLMNSSEHWQKQEEGDRVKLAVSFLSSAYPLMAADRSMAALLTWSRALSGGSVNPLEVTFVRSEHTASQAFKALFGSVRYQQQENSIVLSLATFNQAIQGANPYLKQLVAQQAQSIRAELPVGKSTTECVTQLLDRDLATYSAITSACSALHMSRATLFRKLKKEGTSFTALVKQARVAKLQAFNSRQMTQDGLAEALGFQDTDSYYRFRKKYH